MKHKSIKNKQQSIDKALEILMEGRTFFDGYFDNPHLSRVDAATKVLLQGIENDPIQDITCEIYKSDTLKVNHVLTYVYGHDKTLIWENTYHLINNKFELVSEQIIGWYYGEPDAENINHIFVS